MLEQHRKSNSNQMKHDKCVSWCKYPFGRNKKPQKCVYVCAMVIPPHTTTTFRPQHTHAHTLVVVIYQSSELDGNERAREKNKNCVAYCSADWQMKIALIHRDKHRKYEKSWKFTKIRLYAIDEIETYHHQQQRQQKKRAQWIFIFP